MKKETKPYYSTIEISIFRTGVLIFVSTSRKDILNILPEVYKTFGLKKEALKGDKKLIEAVWDTDEDHDYMPPGETIRLANASGDVIMVFNADTIANISEELIVHETHHAATYLCTFRGIQDEECEAYIQEYLFNQILCKIDEWNNNYKKNKKCT